MADFTERDFMIFFRNKVLPQMRLQIRDRLKSMLADSGMIGPKELEELCLACFKSADEKIRAYLREKNRPDFRFSRETTNYLFRLIINEIKTELPVGTAPVLRAIFGAETIELAFETPALE